eukprot:CAMPEP_0171193722 /NCGR_PEP_ID=MMETSP0790-20130122/20525_1 /TAXON_ID=2925 /ORGANISM="Alexandrium catenella, Strain OF101" /LENGTH=124 /DNA_ID=CAMNT_0011658907 /DNA_START=73 /DNA_END=447 /DNA_ORIENTATION=-
MAARPRSPLAVVVLALAAGGLLSQFLAPTFLPSPATAAPPRAPSPAAVATTAALAAAAVQPLPAWALEGDDEDGFDVRILAILALPLFGISWALFNVWRVAFRQVIRIGESADGSSKQGLAPED